LLPSCSSFLAALLLLLINLWWSSKWPWSLVDWAGIFVVVSEMVLVLFEVRWASGEMDNEASVWCGCLWCAGGYLSSVQNINLACLPS
jgi:hypothetical protein